MTKIELEDGKYTVIFDNGKLSALRYGEPWRDLTGDKLIYCLMAQIENLKEDAEKWREFCKFFTEDEDVVCEGIKSKINYHRIVRQRDYFKDEYNKKLALVEAAKRQVSAAKSQTTKLRNKYEGK